MNVVQAWTRNHDNPHQLRGVPRVRFLNDTIRSNASFPCDPNFAR